MELGILADAILGEVKIPLSEIRSDTPVIQGIQKDFVEGLAGDGTAVFNIRRFLSDERIVVHQEVEI